jgi:DNA-binding NarL/FixJ family response regulator
MNKSSERQIKNLKILIAEDDENSQTYISIAVKRFCKIMIIIAQTAYGLDGDREKAIAAGCNEYVSKPLNLATLNNLIKKLFT